MYMNVNNIKVLIFDSDDISKTLIESYLKEATFSFEIQRYSEFDKSLIEDDGFYKLILIDINRNNLNILKEIRDLVIDSKNMIVLMSGESNTDLYVKSLRSGAKDFLRKPLVKADFLNSVQNIYKKELLIEENKDRSKLISITSYEKGCGKTFFAINIAREVAGLTREKVLLIDFNNNLNNISFSLDIEPVFDTNYFLRTVTEANAPKYFSKIYNYKKSSLYIISNGLYTSSKAGLQSDNVYTFFKIAEKYFKYIFVDINLSLDITNEVLFNNSDLIFYIISTSMIANDRSKRYINSNLSHKKIRVLLNKYRTKDENKIADIEKTLGRDIFYKIPLNVSVMSSPANKGKTIREINQGLDIVKSYNKIARYIINRV